MKTIAYLKKRCTGNNFAPVRTHNNEFDYEILFRLKSKHDLGENDIREILLEMEKLLRGRSYNPFSAEYQLKHKDEIAKELNKV